MFEAKVLKGQLNNLIGIWLAFVVRRDS